MNIVQETVVAGNQTREAILGSAVELFAESGYSGVSMRDLARACGITPAALYHHFDNKRSLYVESIKHSFKERTQGLEKMLEQTDSGEQTVRSIMGWFTDLIAGDVIFRRLLHRELLDGDAERLRLITEQVLREPFERITRTVEQVYPKMDASFVGLTVISALLGHFELAPVRGFLGIAEEGYDNELIGDRITNLILHGFQGV